MKLDYGTQLSPSPIRLSIGSIKKPRLIDIANITFGRFDMYESLLKLTPEKFLSQIITEDGRSIYEMFPDEEKSAISMFDIICMNENLANEYVSAFQFFFVEKVIFRDGFFILLNCDIDKQSVYSKETGRIGKDNFHKVVNIIEQICCIDDKSDTAPPKFKNERARKLYEKMNKGKFKSAKKADLNYTIPNLISAVCSMHNSINMTNVWELTIFQLLDQFNRLTTNAVYQIEQTRVSVWGDEKKTFDAAAWYKNEFDKK